MQYSLLCLLHICLLLRAGEGLHLNMNDDMNKNIDL